MFDDCMDLQVHLGAGAHNLAIQSLVRAKETQNRVLKRALLGQPSILPEQKQQFAKICQMLGDMAKKQSYMEFAIRSMKEVCCGVVLFLFLIGKPIRRFTFLSCKWANFHPEG